MTQTRRQIAADPLTPLRRKRRHDGLLLGLLVTIVVTLATVTGLVLVRDAAGDGGRQYLSTDGWPAQGQGAYQVGDQLPHASAGQHPVPIASVAKVMTALVVLQELPLREGDAGPAFTVTERDVADTAVRRARDESVVPVRAGEKLSERDALMALLLPSANNIAVLLAREVAGTVDEFVVRMNRTAAGMGMQHTTYTDPSGFDSGTVSTATDQLILAEAAAKNAQLSAMMATPSYRLPVAGVVHNTDTLLGHKGFVGMKTGSHDAAGGCFMFLAYRSVDGINVPVVGVVLGQHGHRLVDAALTAAEQLVDRIAPEAAHP